MDGFSHHTPIIRMRVSRERLLLFAAAGLALSLFVAASVVIRLKNAAARPGDTYAGAGRVVSTPPLGTIALLAPQGSIARGSALDQAQASVKEVYWQRRDVPPDAVRDRSELTGMYAKEDLKAEFPILRSQLATEAASASLPITPGMRAMPIDVDVTAAREGHALPGTRVDVILTYSDADGKTVSQFVVENALVLTSGGEDKRSKPDKFGAGTQTVTLEVSPRDSLAISTAAQMGRLRLVTRNPGDGEPAPDPKFNSGQFQNPVAPQGPKPTCVNPGKIKVGDEQYIFTCEGNVVPLQNLQEP